MARAPRGADPPKVSARLATILSCSPVSQFLLLDAGNIRHIALNLPVNVTYQSSPLYAFDMTTKNDIHSWTEFLTMIHPRLHPTDPRLILTWDAKAPQHLESYFEWPEEWRGKFTHVGMTLLTTEANSVELKKRLVAVAEILLMRQINEMPAFSGMEPVYEEPTRPPCEVHGETCPHFHLQQPRRSEMSRYTLRMAA